MPVQFSISTAGGDEIAATLLDIERTVEDWRGAWPAVSSIFYKQMERHFASEGSAGRSGRWAPLSTRYSAWKQEFFPGRKILELTGRLKESLTNPSSPDAVEVRSARFLFIGSNVPYAGFHQEGTGRMPRRPPISPTDREVYEWVAAMQRHLNDRIRASVGRSTGKLSMAFR